MQDHLGEMKEGTPDNIQLRALCFRTCTSPPYGGGISKWRTLLLRTLLYVVRPVRALRPFKAAAFRSCAHFCCAHFCMIVARPVRTLRPFMAAAFRSCVHFCCVHFCMLSGPCVHFAPLSPLYGGGISELRKLLLRTLLCVVRGSFFHRSEIIAPSRRLASQYM